jgi:hypothetical protein
MYLQGQLAQLAELQIRKWESSESKKKLLVKPRTIYRRGNVRLSRSRGSRDAAAA